ncbi:MAG TPA: hypothetical protein VIW92_07450 [Thermoanaerobaculia bacterium]
MEPPRVEPPPPPASPFNPTPQPAIPRAGGSGCPKPLIIGCLAVLVVGGLALIGGFWWIGSNLDRFMAFALQQTENAVFAQLPQDVTSEERDRLRSAFQAARQRMASAGSKEVAQDAQQLMMELQTITRSDMTRKDIQRLTETLEKFASGGGGPPAQP